MDPRAADHERGLTATAGLFLHGFGPHVDVPVSAVVSFYAAAGVVLLSFLLVVALLGSAVGPAALRYRRRRVPWLEAAAVRRAARVVGGAVGLAGLVLTVAAGLFGPSDPLRNLADYLVWIGLWVGLVLLAAAAGNIWPLLNPFGTISDGLTRLGVRGPMRRLPERLGSWPALAVYFGLTWLELCSGVSSQPRVLAGVVFGYTALTVAGMWAFGRDDWLGRCEAFTVLLDVAGRFAPVEAERSGGAPRVFLRPWAVGLLRTEGQGWDRVGFVLLTLSGLAFDSLLGTRPWLDATSAVAPASSALGSAVGMVVVRTAGLVVITLLFLAVFSLFIRLVMYFGVVPVDRRATMVAFAFTLVPIAIAYDAAHYLAYLLVRGQGLVPLLADPLGRGWRLLPTAGYRPVPLLATPSALWTAQVCIVVAGHVVAVYLGHRRAGERFQTAAKVLLSQYPMLLLMIGYTTTSLWLLSSGGTP